MGKNDKRLFFFILLAAFLLGGAFFLLRGEGRYVYVQVDKEAYGRYRLDQDQVIEIPGGEGTANRLEIRDGKADMVYADCPDQLCVHMAPISASKETIVCLPNKVFVEIVEK